MGLNTVFFNVFLQMHLLLAPPPVNDGSGSGFRCDSFTSLFVPSFGDSLVGVCGDSICHAGIWLLWGSLQSLDHGAIPLFLGFHPLERLHCFIRLELLSTDLDVKSEIAS